MLTSNFNRSFQSMIYIIFVLLSTVTLTVDGFAQSISSSSGESGWLDLDATERDEIERYATAYKAFMHEAKTELAFVTETINRLRAAGFEQLQPDSHFVPGARFYDVNRDRTISLIVVGSEPLEQGFRVVGAHIDSPRLELKPRPVYGREEFALFQTNYHGGIKNYQWTSLPLALMGRVDKKDGTTIQVSVGNDPGEPVFVIPELSPHTSAPLSGRTARGAISSEELDPLAGHIPLPDKTVVDGVFDYLSTNFGIERDDLVSSELSLVPAFAPNDIGFDRGLMAIYGQDDRLCGYDAMQAVIDIDTPRYTSIAFLVDNEESGSNNNTGARSSYLTDLMGRLMYTQMQETYQERWLRHALRRTKVVSCDVNPGVNPLWPSAWESGNAPRLGYGVGIKLYGRGFNANSEYIAWIRKVLDENAVPWQTVTYKVDSGGGGTIGGFLSDDNMDVIDFGVPVLSIHTPYGISSKVDVFQLYRSMKAFYEEP